MSKTIQIRDVDDDVYRELLRRAAEEGMSVPEFLRREIRRLANRPSMKEWLERTRQQAPSDITPDEIIEALDEMRGPWPNAGR